MLAMPIELDFNKMTVISCINSFYFIPGFILCHTSELAGVSFYGILRFYTLNDRSHKCRSRILEFNTETTSIEATIAKATSKLH